MFERLKAAFAHSKTPAFPETVWALTVLLNPNSSKRMSREEAIAFAIRNVDDIAERTVTLYYGGDEYTKTAELFTSEHDACDRIGALCERCFETDGDYHGTTFGLVLLRREVLYSVFEGEHNLNLTLDFGLPGEREVAFEELKHYAKDQSKGSLYG